jgi:hypothetical protein
MLNPIVASGPYIGYLNDDQKKQNPAKILQQARSALNVISALPEAKKFLESQINNLFQNTSDKIANTPDFKTLNQGEKNLSESSNTEAPIILEVIKLIKEAFSVQRFQHQTKPIEKMEQVNFAKLLNQRIDPIDQDGIRAKTREQPIKFGLFQETMSELAIEILRVPATVLTLGSEKLGNLNKEFLEKFDIKRTAAKLYKELRGESNRFFSNMNSLIPREDAGPESIMPKVISSIGGGLENAMSLHLAFVKVSFDKLKQKIPNIDSEDFKKSWIKVLKNLSHISKQFSSVQAYTLKLVENLNGVRSNQPEIYDFKPENFELVPIDDKLFLLPTIDFLQKVITQANDNTTEVFSHNVSSKDSQKVNFAKEYFPPQGCPIHGAKGNLNGEKFKLDEQYLAIMDGITNSVFGIPDPRAS